jgi:hypothetical protein
MKLLSLFFYHLGDIASVTICHWRWGGWIYKKLMLISVDCDTNFEIWKKPRQRKSKKK